MQKVVHIIGRSSTFPFGSYIDNLINWPQLW